MEGVYMLYIVQELFPTVMFQISQARDVVFE